MRTYNDLHGDGGSDILGQVVAQRQAVADRLAQVGAVIAVMSGKGGVGKSTVTVGLADALARAGRRVGVTDADVNGPSVPRLLGVTARPGLGGDAMTPPEDARGIAVMSTDLFLARDDEPMRYAGPKHDAYAWRPTAEVSTVREMLANTGWGRRDVLLLDLPPGSERLPDLLNVLPKLAGAVAVTIGSPLSLAIVRKSITSARDHGVRVLGLAENMAAHACESCSHETPLFGSLDAAPRAAAESGVAWLGAIPFDPALADPPGGRCLDGAAPRTLEAFDAIASAILKTMSRGDA